MSRTRAHNARLLGTLCMQSRSVTQLWGSYRGPVPAAFDPQARIQLHGRSAAVPVNVFQLLRQHVAWRRPSLPSLDKPSNLLYDTDFGWVCSLHFWDQLQCDVDVRVLLCFLLPLTRAALPPQLGKWLARRGPNPNVDVILNVGKLFSADQRNTQHTQNTHTKK
jgi:hypothetical protein